MTVLGCRLFIFVCGIAVLGHDTASNLNIQNGNSTEEMSVTKFGDKLVPKYQAM